MSGASHRHPALSAACVLVLAAVCSRGWVSVSAENVWGSPTTVLSAAANGCTPASVLLEGFIHSTEQSLLVVCAEADAPLRLIDLPSLTDVAPKYGFNLTAAGTGYRWAMSAVFLSHSRPSVLLVRNVADSSGCIIEAHTLVSSPAYFELQPQGNMFDFCPSGALVTTGVADLNGDGKDDLFVVGADGIDFYLQAAANPLFRAGISLELPPTLAATAIDLNDDGYPELVAVTHSQLIVLLNGCSASRGSASVSFATIITAFLPLATEPVSLAVVDPYHTGVSPNTILVGGADGAFRSYLLDSVSLAVQELVGLGNPRDNASEALLYFDVDGDTWLDLYSPTAGGGASGSLFLSVGDGSYFDPAKADLLPALSLAADDPPPSAMAVGGFENTAMSTTTTVLAAVVGTELLVFKTDHWSSRLAFVSCLNCYSLHLLFLSSSLASSPSTSGATTASSLASGLRRFRKFGGTVACADARCGSSRQQLLVHAAEDTQYSVDMTRYTTTGPILASQRRPSLMDPLLNRQVLVLDRTDPCLATEPCNGHGTCMSDTGCVCNLGWTGTFCADPAACPFHMDPALFSGVSVFGKSSLRIDAGSACGRLRSRGMVALTGAASLMATERAAGLDSATGTCATTDYAILAGTVSAATDVTIVGDGQVGYDGGGVLGLPLEVKDWTQSVPLPLSTIDDVSRATDAVVKSLFAYGSGQVDNTTAVLYVDIPAGSTDVTVDLDPDVDGPTIIWVLAPLDNPRPALTNVTLTVRVPGFWANPRSRVFVNLYSTGPDEVEVITVENFHLHVDNLDPSAVVLLVHNESLTRSVVTFEHCNLASSVLSFRNNLRFTHTNVSGAVWAPSPQLTDCHLGCDFFAGCVGYDSAASRPASTVWSPSVTLSADVYPTVMVLLNDTSIITVSGNRSALVLLTLGGPPSDFPDVPVSSETLAASPFGCIFGVVADLGNDELLLSLLCPVTSTSTLELFYLNSRSFAPTSSVVDGNSFSTPLVSVSVGDWDLDQRADVVATWGSSDSAFMSLLVRVDDVDAHIFQMDTVSVPTATLRPMSCMIVELDSTDVFPELVCSFWDMSHGVGVWKNGCAVRPGRRPPVASTVWTAPSPPVISTARSSIGVTVVGDSRLGRRSRIIRLDDTGVIHVFEYASSDGSLTFLAQATVPLPLGVFSATTTPSLMLFDIDTDGNTDIVVPFSGPPGCAVYSVLGTPPDPVLVQTADPSLCPVYSVQSLGVVAAEMGVEGGTSLLFFHNSTSLQVFARTPVDPLAVAPRAAVSVRLPLGSALTGTVVLQSHTSRSVATYHNPGPVVAGMFSHSPTRRWVTAFRAAGEGFSVTVADWPHGAPMGWNVDNWVTAPATLDLDPTACSPDSCSGRGTCVHGRLCVCTYPYTGPTCADMAACPLQLPVWPKALVGTQAVVLEDSATLFTVIGGSVTASRCDIGSGLDSPSGTNCMGYSVGIVGRPLILEDLVAHGFHVFTNASEASITGEELDAWGLLGVRDFDVPLLASAYSDSLTHSYRVLAALPPDAVLVDIKPLTFSLNSTTMSPLIAVVHLELGNATQFEHTLHVETEAGLDPATTLVIVVHCSSASLDMVLRLGVAQIAFTGAGGALSPRRILWLVDTPSVVLRLPSSWTGSLLAPQTHVAILGTPGVVFYGTVLAKSVHALNIGFDHPFSQCDSFPSASHWTDPVPLDSPVETSTPMMVQLFDVTRDNVPDLVLTPLLDFSSTVAVYNATGAGMFGAVDIAPALDLDVTSLGTTVAWVGPLLTDSTSYVTCQHGTVASGANVSHPANSGCQFHTRASATQTTFGTLFLEVDLFLGSAYVPGEVFDWAAADYDRNGRLDFAVTSSDSVMVFSQPVRAQFVRVLHYVLDEDVYQVLWADVTADQQVDLVVATGSGVLYFVVDNYGVLQPAAFSINHPFGIVLSVAAVNVGADPTSPVLDLVTASTDGTITVMRNLVMDRASLPARGGQAHGFQVMDPNVGGLRGRYGGPAVLLGMTVVDVNGDGHGDLIAVGGDASSAAYPRVLLWTAAYTFELAIAVDAASDFSSVLQVGLPDGLLRRLAVTVPAPQQPITVFFASKNVVPANRVHRTTVRGSEANPNRVRVFGVPVQYEATAWLTAIVDGAVVAVVPASVRSSSVGVQNTLPATMTVPFNSTVDVKVSGTSRVSISQRQYRSLWGVPAGSDVVVDMDAPCDPERDCGSAYSLCDHWGMCVCYPTMHGVFCDSRSTCPFSMDGTVAQLAVLANGGVVLHDVIVMHGGVATPSTFFAVNSTLNTGSAPFAVSSNGLALVSTRYRADMYYSGSLSISGPPNDLGGQLKVVGGTLVAVDTAPRFAMLREVATFYASGASTSPLPPGVTPHPCRTTRSGSSMVFAAEVPNSVCLADVSIGDLDGVDALSTEPAPESDPFESDGTWVIVNLDCGNASSVVLPRILSPHGTMNGRVVWNIITEPGTTVASGPAAVYWSGFLLAPDASLVLEDMVFDGQIVALTLEASHMTLVKTPLSQSCDLVTFIPPSGSATASATPSATVSATPSQTPSPPPSTSPSTSQVPPPSASATPTATPTATASSTPSTAVGPSASSTPAESSTPTPSLSVGASPSPSAVPPLFVALNGGTQTIATGVVPVVVAEGAPATVDVALPVAPAPGENVRLECTPAAVCFGSPDAGAVSFSPQLLFYSLASWDTPVKATVTAVASRNNSRPGLTGCTVECATHSSSGSGVYSRGSTARFSVYVVPAVYPFFSDILVYSTRNPSAPPTSSLALGSGAFALTVGGDETRVVVVGDTSLRLTDGPHFLPGVEVHVGGLPANASIADDRQSMTVVLPTFEALCVAGGGTLDSCGDTLGYFPLSVANPPSSDSPFAVGVSVACPPTCPGAVASATPSSGVFYALPCIGNYTTGTACLDAAVATTCGLGSGGDCARCPEGGICPGGYRLWAQPGYWVSGEAATSTQVCAAPRFKRCIGWTTATGAAGCGLGYEGPRCGSCSPGFFSSSGSHGACERCPDLPGFMDLFAPALVLAGAAAAVFLVMAGSTVLVVRRKGGEPKMVLAAAAEFTVWSVLTLQLIAQVGKNASPNLPSFVRTLYTGLGLVILEFSVVTSPACATNTHLFFAELIQMSTALVMTALGVLMFSRRFRLERCVTVCLRPCRKSTRNRRASVLERKSVLKQKVTPLLRRALFVLCSLVYPLATNAALSVIICEDVEVSDDAGRLVHQRRLSNNPNVVCYEGEHLLAGVLGWVTLLGFSVGYPLATLTYLLRIRKLQDITADTKPTDVSAALKYWFFNSYRVDTFWMRHVDMVLLGALAVLGATLVGTSSGSASGRHQVAFLTVTLLLLAAACGVLVLTAPYLAVMNWKLPVRVLSLLVTMLATALNFATFKQADNASLDQATQTTDEADPTMAVKALSFLLFIVCGTLFVVLFGAFWWVLVRAAAKSALVNKLEQKDGSDDDDDGRDKSMSAWQDNPMRRAPNARAMFGEGTVGDTQRRPGSVQHIDTQTTPSQILAGLRKQSLMVTGRNTFSPMVRTKRQERKNGEVEGEVEVEVEGEVEGEDGGSAVQPVE